MGLVLLLKFKDPKTIAYVDRQLSRGWYWARNSAEALIHTGELSMIPMVANYLSVDKPSEAEPPMDDVIFAGAPSFYAAQVIASLLRESYQSPDTVRMAMADRRLRNVGSELWLRWWADNHDHCNKGDFAHLTSPLNFITSTPIK